MDLTLLETLPPGWRTDLGVLALGGASIEERPGYLVVRSPENPTYHWGNFVMVTDTAAVDDAARWVDVFAAELPGAGHLAIGLAAVPDPAAWAAVGEVELDDVLATGGDPQPRPLPAGYRVRTLATAEDWARSTALADLCYPGEPEFQERRTRTRAAMAAAGDLTWFGAFEKASGELASELGMAHLPGVGRYQSVLTHPEHRRRGLTGHLLGEAARCARERGAGSLVIVADADGDAGRLYRAVGFVPVASSAQVYRKPA